MKNKPLQIFEISKKNSVEIKYIEDTDENICAYVASIDVVTLKGSEIYALDGTFILSTIGNFLDRVPDQIWLQEIILPILIPLQIGERLCPPITYLHESTINKLINGKGS